MKKKQIIIITSAVIVLVAAIVGVAIFFFGEKLELPKLTAEDISTVYYEELIGKGVKKDLDIEEFLGYYNQIYDVKDEVDGGIGTTLARIVIELKNGEEINMHYNQGNQFSVSFRDSEGEYHQYFGEQQEIADMLAVY